MAETEERMMESPVDRRFVPLVKSVPDMMVLRAKALMRASQIAGSRGARGDVSREVSNSGAEFSVRSKSGMITGRIDRVIDTNGGIVLQDYKSGPITAREGGAAEVKPEFRQQLHLYAILYFETAGAWPVRLELVPLVGDSAEVSFTPSECLKILDEAERAVRDIDVTLTKFAATPELAEQQLARPSPTACRFCPYRPACSTYLAFDRTGLDDWPADAWGKVASVTKLGNGNLAIGIRTANGDILYVRDVDERVCQPPMSLSDFIDCKIGLFSARLGKSPKAMEAGPYTSVFLSKS